MGCCCNTPDQEEFDKLQYKVIQLEMILATLIRASDKKFVNLYSGNMSFDQSYLVDHIDGEQFSDPQIYYLNEDHRLLKDD